MAEKKDNSVFEERSNVQKSQPSQAHLLAKPVAETKPKSVTAGDKRFVETANTRKK